MRLVSKLSLAAAMAVSIPALCAGAEPVGIAELAPKDSFVVITIPSWPQMRQNFDQTSLSKVWKDPAVQKFVDDVVSEEKKDDPSLGEMLNEMRESAKEVDEPTGSVGLVVYMGDVPKAEGLTDDTARPAKAPQFLLMSDFGAGAEAAETKMMSLLEKAKSKGSVKLDERKAGDVTVHVVTVIEKEDENDPAQSEVDEDMNFGGDDALPTMNTMQVARVGSVMLVGSHEATFDAAIEKVETGKGESIASDKAYTATLQQHPADTHAYATFVLTDSLRTQIRDQINEMAPMMGVEVDPVKIIESTGLSKFHSLSLGLRFNTDRGDMEQSIAVLAPEKAGLFTLFDAEPSPFTPPAFVGPDASTVARFSFRFDRLFDVIKGIVANMPEEMRQQAQSGIQGVESSFGPALKALGPDVYQIQSIARPLSPTSQKSVYAIKCGDELAVNNALVGFAGMMQLEPRDFQGFQIYDGQASEMALGIGAGYVFVGNSDSVESMLRMAAQPGESQITSDPRFKDAIGTLRTDGNAYSFVSTRETVEYAIWQMQNMDKVMKAQYAAMGLDEEENEASEALFKDAVPAWSKKLPPVETLTQYFGDTVFAFKPTPDGFRGHSISLRPRKPK